MIIATLALAAFVQDQVDNPEFKAWAVFKPGSSVTFKLPQGDQKSTLKTVADNEVVLETEFIIGGKVMGKPMERKVTSKVPAAEAPKMLKEGEEEIEAGGKKLKCSWKEFETKTANAKTVVMKIWLHDEIPGKAAKVEVNVEGAPKQTMVASAWEKK